MKKVLLFAFLPLAIFTGCTEKQVEQAVQAISYVNANVGTTPFKSSSVNSIYTVSGTVTQLTITANGPTGGEYILLQIKNFNKTNNIGIYSIGTASSSLAIAAYNRPNSSANEVATSGQMEIKESANGIIRGTFYFTTNASQITSGDFTLVLPA